MMNFAIEIIINPGDPGDDVYDALLGVDILFGTY
jgi:hypothetical protein